MTKMIEIRITIEIENSQRMTTEFVIQSEVLGNECPEIRYNSDENSRLLVQIS